MDAVVSANLLEHVPDDRRALREMARVLRPGAQAVIVVPAGPGPTTTTTASSATSAATRAASWRGSAARRGSSRSRTVHLALASLPGLLARQAAQPTPIRRPARRGARGARGRRHRPDPRLARRARTWHLETRLVRAGVRLPFGIRSLVVARRERRVRDEDAQRRHSGLQRGGERRAPCTSGCGACSTALGARLGADLQRRSVPGPHRGADPRAARARSRG